MSSRGFKRSGKKSDEYKIVLHHLQDINTTLQANEAAAASLRVTLIEEEWIDFTDKPSPQQMMTIVLNRIKSTPSEYHVFMAMLDRVTGLDLIKKKIEETASSKLRTRNYGSTGEHKPLQTSRDLKSKSRYSSAAASACPAGYQRQVKTYYEDLEDEVYEKERRQAELTGLHSEIEDMQYIFEDLQTMVGEQGETVDVLERQLKGAADVVRRHPQGHAEPLVVTVKRKPRLKILIIVLSVLIAAFVIVIVTVVAVTVTLKTK